MKLTVSYVNQQQQGQHIVRTSQDSLQNDVEQLVSSFRIRNLTNQFSGLLGVAIEEVEDITDVSS